MLVEYDRTVVVWSNQLPAQSEVWGDIYQLTENNEKIIIVTLIKVNLLPQNLEFNTFVSMYGVVWQFWYKQSQNQCIHWGSETLRTEGITKPYLF